MGDMGLALLFKTAGVMVATGCKLNGLYLEVRLVWGSDDT
jgi:hypothetical protein